ncbi:MAG: hypothetical protein K0U41_07020 [Gammaproteobacteria bacterium]|nr:hypothetical protein [Gammaproteobacteria bacterium]
MAPYGGAGAAGLGAAPAKVGKSNYGAVAAVESTGVAYNTRKKEEEAKQTKEDNAFEERYGDYTKDWSSNGLGEDGQMFLAKQEGNLAAILRDPNMSEQEKVVQATRLQNSTKSVLESMKADARRGDAIRQGGVPTGQKTDGSTTYSPISRVSKIDGSLYLAKSSLNNRFQYVYDKEAGQHRKVGYDDEGNEVDISAAENANDPAYDIVPVHNIKGLQDELLDKYKPSKLIGVNNDNNNLVRGNIAKDISRYVFSAFQNNESMLSLIGDYSDISDSDLLKLITETNNIASGKGGDERFVANMQEKYAPQVIGAIGTETYGDALTPQSASPVSGRSGSGDDAFKPNKDYITTTTDILDESASDEEVTALTDNILGGNFEGFDTNNSAIEFDDSEGFRFGFGSDEDGQEGRDAKGTVTLNGVASKFESKEDLENIIRGVVQPNSEVSTKFSDVKNLVTGNNYGQIVTDLGINYRGKGYDFEPTNKGIKISVGTKSLNVPMNEVSASDRAKDIQDAIDYLTK